MSHRAHRDGERDQGGCGRDRSGHRTDPVPDRLQVDLTGRDSDHLEHEVIGGDHSFKVPGGKKKDDGLEAIMDTVAAWIVATARNKRP